MPILRTALYAVTLRLLVACYPLAWNMRSNDARNEIDNRLFYHHRIPFRFR